MYHQDHMLLTLIGDAWAGTEEWSIGVRLTPPPGTTDPAAFDLAAIAAAAAVPSQTFHQSPQMSHPAGVRLTRIKVAAIDKSTGRYFPTIDSVEHIYPTPIPGAVDSTVTAGAAYTLPQSAIAVTLTTPSTRGLASKGRIFLPPCVVPLDADGTFSTTRANGIADTVKTWINAIRAIPAVGDVVIFSKGKGVRSVDANGKVTWTYPTVGQGRIVTGVRVGRVVDTQRRRRRQLIEAPVSVAL